MWMRLVFARRLWPRATINPAHQIAPEQFYDLGDTRYKCARQKQQTCQHALHQTGRMAADADTIRALLHATGTVNEQSAQVVGQHFGGDINDTGLLAQAAAAFNFQAVLEAFEGFFDAAALVVQLPKNLNGKHLRHQVGEQDTHLATGADTSQPHAWGLPKKRVILGILNAGHAQGNYRLAGTAAQKLAHHLETAVIIAAHAKADTLLLQQGNQPSGRIASVKHQHIIGLQVLQVHKKHLTLARLGAAELGMQAQLRAGQIQAKQALIGLGCKARLVARTGGGHEHRGVFGHHTQAMPKRHPASGLSQVQQLSIQGCQGGGLGFVACLGKGAVTGYALKTCVTGQAGEKGVQHQLLRLSALAKQSTHETRQGQFALANKGGGLGASGQIIAACESNNETSFASLQGTARDAFSRIFLPALLARINVLPYRPLEQTVPQSIATKHLNMLREILLLKNKIILNLVGDIAGWIARKVDGSPNSGRAIYNRLPQSIFPHLSDQILIANRSDVNISSVSLVLADNDQLDIYFN
jgi:hypothetical protein